MDKDLERIERRLDRLEENNRELIRLTTLMEQEVKLNRKQSETLEKMNDNLTNLNNRFPSLEVKVDELENKFEKMEENGSLSFDDIMKKGFWIIFVALLTAVLVHFGL